MRVAFVTRQFPPHGVGGIGAYVDTVSAALAAAGHEVTVVTAADGVERRSEQRGPVRVEYFPAVLPRALGRLARRSPMAASRVSAAVSARRALRDLGARFDVVEVPEWRAEGLLLGRRWGPTVVHLHLSAEVVRRWGGVGAERGLGVRLAELLERRAVGRAAAVTATSQLSGRLPDGSAWLPGVDLRLVAPPIDLETWDGLPPPADAPPVVLFVGHLERRKAPELLVAAASRLRGEVPDVEVRFVGRSFRNAAGEDHEAWLRRLAGEAGVRCSFTPPEPGIEAMRRHYARARVVAVPSRFETLSMVALEALASGRPSVVTDAVGASEHLGDLARELVVPVDDIEALTRALRPFLVDPAHADDLGRRGRERVSELCGGGRIVADRLAVYDSVRDGGR